MGDGLGGALKNSYNVTGVWIQSSWGLQGRDSKLEREDNVRSLMQRRRLNLEGK